MVKQFPHDYAFPQRIKADGYILEATLTMLSAFILIPSGPTLLNTWCKIDKIAGTECAVNMEPKMAPLDISFIHKRLHQNMARSGICLTNTVH